jgi:hypothetical protein
LELGVKTFGRLPIALLIATIVILLLSCSPDPVSTSEVAGEDGPSGRGVTTSSHDSDEATAQVTIEFLQENEGQEIIVFADNEDDVPFFVDRNGSVHFHILHGSRLALPPERAVVQSTSGEESPGSLVSLSFLGDTGYVRISDLSVNRPPRDSVQDRFQLPSNYTTWDGSDPVVNQNYVNLRGAALSFYESPFPDYPELSPGRSVTKEELGRFLEQCSSVKKVSFVGPQGGARWNNYECDSSSMLVIGSLEPYIFRVVIDSSAVNLTHGVAVGKDINDIVMGFGQPPMVNGDWIGYAYSNNVLSFKYVDDKVSQISLSQFLWD